MPWRIHPSEAAAASSPRRRRTLPRSGARLIPPSGASTSPRTESETSSRPPRHFCPRRGPPLPSEPPRIRPPRTWQRPSRLSRRSTPRASTRWGSGTPVRSAPTRPPRDDEPRSRPGSTIRTSYRQVQRPGGVGEECRRRRRRRPLRPLPRASSSVDVGSPPRQSPPRPSSTPRRRRPEARRGTAGRCGTESRRPSPLCSLRRHRRRRRRRRPPGPVDRPRRRTPSAPRSIRRGIRPPGEK
mmetsp:Transcript_4672/g.13168  ORF Transcript_4672/g.13168 Transcript_4672/m.13168 type:complete len:241 (-) Transcript_4672:106-828(-)